MRGNYCFYYRTLQSYLRSHAQSKLVNALQLENNFGMKYLIDVMTGGGDLIEVLTATGLLIMRSS